LNSYLKLVHMEIYRFRYMLAAMMGITMIIQIGALIVYLTGELASRDDYFEQYGKANEAFGPISFARAISITQFWFGVSLLICIAVLSLYVFLIWYRDWYGRSSFIYRLLMLPTARRHVYLAKLTAILIFVFGLVSFQLILLPVEKTIFHLIVPADTVEPSYMSEAIAAHRIFDTLLIPRNFDQFLFSYGLGTAVVLVIFTVILIERSYRLLGKLYALLYAAGCTIAFIFPLYALGYDHPTSYLYQEEIVGIQFLICVLIVVGSVWLALRLLKKKITV